MHPYTMKGFTGTISPYPYFNAKTDAEGIEAALMLRRGKEGHAIAFCNVFSDILID